MSLDDNRNCTNCTHYALTIGSEPCKSCEHWCNWESSSPDSAIGSGVDMVTRPSHYMLFPEMEAIEAIRKVLSPAEYRGYLKGNILKYRLRAGRKGDDSKALEDLRKSEQYHTFLTEA